MESVVRFALATILLALVSAVAACGDDAGPLVAELRISDPRDPAGFSPGEPISIRLELHNSQDETLIVVSDRDPPYSFRIHHVDTITNVWSSDFGPRHVTYRELAAGEKLDYGVNWDQTDERGRQVPPGLYRTTFSFTGNCEPDDCTVSLDSSFEIVR
jgi:hypothetical protein